MAASPWGRFSQSMEVLKSPPLLPPPQVYSHPRVRTLQQLFGAVQQQRNKKAKRIEVCWHYAAFLFLVL